MIMSKRFIFPQQHGERKKAKLDISISDHNFPLSQNKDVTDNWGDDNDDEILLLASQACEQAISSNDISSLPDYSMCMQPTTTSTQMFDQPGSSTSKSPFTFKKPTTHPSNSITTNLKDKCNRISSPLPGMLSKVTKSNDFIDNYTFNDKVYKDSDQIYRQLLQLQEENSKLKSENGKLQEKCVTKEGEASILRTQLKSCQAVVDSARIEKMKAQEKLQTEWTEKLTTANGQLHDLRNQLDFKNLEIISIKERCRMLESNKIKLTQVNVSNNDINMSHRNNSSNINDTTLRKRVRTCNTGIQTVMKTHFMELSKSSCSEPSKLSSILPLVLQSSDEQHLSLLAYNEKLQKHTDFAQNKCRIYSTYYRMPSTPTTIREEKESNVNMTEVYENLTCIAARRSDGLIENYFNIFAAAKQLLSRTMTELEIISSRSSTAFQKEMDEKYINATSCIEDIHKQELLTSRALFKEEQAILSRRVTSILFYIIDSVDSFNMLQNYEQLNTDAQNTGKITDIILLICKQLDSSSCALLYSGLLLSIVYLLNKLIKFNRNAHISKTTEIIKTIVISRPLPIVSCKILKVLRKMSVDEQFLMKFCPGSSTGNLKLDFEQGVLLYKKDSCYLQVLLKQVEASLKCVEKQTMVQLAAKITKNLISICSNMNNDSGFFVQDKTRCDCRLVLMQVIVYALRICAVMLNHSKDYEYNLLPTCRSGLFLLYRSCIDAESTSTLTYNEGHFLEFCEVMKKYQHEEVYSNMLVELSSTFTLSPCDELQASHSGAWFNSFDHFSIVD